jgi:hypothetical protein
METSLLSHFLPDGILDHFDIDYYGQFCYLQTREEGFLIHLIEMNIVPSDYDSSEFESKGFLPATTIQDFPIRGKLLYLSIKRRRWRKKADKNFVITTDYSFLTEKIKMTKDLSDFLKGTGREPARYDVEYL